MSRRQLLLIRHGQASFAAADYDQLSPLGVAQSCCLGDWLKACGQRPDLVVHGSLRRHRQTAEHCLAAVGAESPRLELAGLDEIDHVDILAQQRPDLADPQVMRSELKRHEDPRQAFQAIFVAAVQRWTHGQHDADYRCSWPQFLQRVQDALRQLSERQEPVIWAFTSGGPIAVIVNGLLAAPLAQTFALSWPLVNTSLTRIALGRSAHSLITYNAWPHLEQAGDEQLITHR